MMSSPAIATLVKMIETLPEAAQNQAVEYMRAYLEEIQDEMRWDAAFEKSQAKLAAAARRAKQEIAAGHAQPLDFDQL